MILINKHTKFIKSNRLENFIDINFPDYTNQYKWLKEQLGDDYDNLEIYCVTLGNPNLVGAKLMSMFKTDMINYVNRHQMLELELKNPLNHIRFSTKWKSYLIIKR